VPVERADEGRLVADMIKLARQFGRYDYRRIAGLLRDAGRQVNDKRVEHLWRREGLKAPLKQPKKGRLWPNDGSCVRLRPGYSNYVWSYDFVHHRSWRSGFLCDFGGRDLTRIFTLFRGVRMKMMRLGRIFTQIND
jgi:hypothetical protein